MKIKPGLYLHYKGKKYRVHHIAKDSDSLEDCVVYETLYKNNLSRWWVRKAELFGGKIEIDGKLVDRYKYMGK